MGAINKQTIRICDRCQTRFMASPDNADFVHDCGSAESEALREEDVVKVGDFTDFKGTGQEVSGSVGNGQEVNMLGAENRFWGTRAAIEGEDFEGVTARGRSQATHRTRRHFAYKDLRG